MKVLVLSDRDVEELLTMDACIEVMAEALAALARGEVHNPLRMPVRAPGAPGLLGLMPAWRGGETPYYALKEVCVFPGNPNAASTRIWAPSFSTAGTPGSLWRS
jgi:ornithine cyclodeaminase/alanine dehydrogenase-like protein (mu-crystallin family)